MKRRTEVNIELTRTVVMHRSEALCECVVCAEQREPGAAEEAAVLLDVNTRMVSGTSATDQHNFVSNADSGEAIEIESAEGQLIIAAAVRSLELRLSTEARAALRNPPEQPVVRHARFSHRFYAQLRWLRHSIIHPKATRRIR